VNYPGDLMKYLISGILLIFLTVALSSTAVGEIAKMTINTDSTWKSIDFEQEGWTTEGYDDSWWEAVQVYDGNPIDQASEIWYPATEQTMPHTAYFRNSYEIEGTKILSGKLHVGSYGNTNGYPATIELYINNNPLEKITTGYDNPYEVDITSYLTPGKNLITAKVTATHDVGWAMTGLVRYDKVSATSPASPA
jgi:hypothetical protein